MTPKGEIIAALVIAVALFGVLSLQVYARPVDDALVRTLAQVFPYPAISVNHQTVLLKDFLIEYDALIRYFNDTDAQAAPPPDELEIAVADTLINKMAIQQLAGQYGIALDKERVEQYYQEVVESQGGEEAFAQDLEESFGWKTGEFKERIVESIVLALQMTDIVFENDELQQGRVDLIQAAYDRIGSGEDFSLVAKDIHSGFAGLESDLGYIKSSTIPVAWASQVGALEIGEVTGVIDLPEGYAIFKLEDKIVAGEDTQLHLFALSVPKYTLEDVVAEYLEGASVKRYVGTN